MVIVWKSELEIFGQIFFLSLNLDEIFNIPGMDPAWCLRHATPQAMVKDIYRQQFFYTVTDEIE